jgi:3-deoxy-D-manno-octulosonic-acid transferase
VDTTGELRDWYQLATLVFVGKTLTAIGGQNPAEPAIIGKPVVFGPHMENFATLARSLVECDGAIRIENADSLAPVFAGLLRNPERRAALVRHAEQVLAAHRGATQRTAELLLSLQSPRPAR